MIVLQVAISFTLLIGAGLMIRSLWKLQGVDPGFRIGRVLTTRLDLNFTKYTDAAKRWAFEKATARAHGRRAGRRHGGDLPELPVERDGGPNNGRFEVEGRPGGFRRPAPAGGIPARLVRLLLDDRRAAAPGAASSPARIRPRRRSVAVISRSLAPPFLGDEGPDRRADLDGPREDLDHDRRGRGRRPAVRSRRRASRRDLRRAAAVSDAVGSLLVRTTGSPLALSRIVREAVHGIDPDQPIDRFQTLDQARSNALASPRLTATLLRSSPRSPSPSRRAGLAGVMAFTVGERTHEFGIRMALGALPGAVLNLVLRQAMALVAAGLALGLVGAHLLARLMSSLLFEVNATDPPTFLAMSVVARHRGALASFFPARRATTVDPMIALRSA